MEIGYDEAAVKQSWTQGLDGYHRSMQLFEAHAIERALSELGDGILELDRARRRSRTPTCRTHDALYQPNA
jgi:hypothetical protein